MTSPNTTTAANPVRFVLIVGLVLAAFFGAYQFAAARGAAANGAPAGSALAAGGNGSNVAGGGCCGSGQPPAGGVSGDKVEGAATVSGDVQKISVDVSGVYNPNVIKLKAGVPAEITFGQSSGCTSQVISQDLGFFEDLSAGPRTVKLGALAPGEYTFSCGMQMVFGKIVVE